MVKAALSLLLLAGAEAGNSSDRAKALTAQMTLEEKVQMLHGAPGGYVGNVPAIDRLGIPAITMNDGPQGFRDEANPGTSTSFPSGLTVAATWDRALAGKWGEAMGAEFYGKGSNVQLGPGMCLARVPRNGRNFEYLSGEDPYLGHEMVGPVIAGIQSKGVVANAKHYILNNQETNRNSVSANVDERTRFEMYYPPFVGAIEANVGSIMCSYNKVNHVYSCENDETLRVDLKERLGFEGWVMSDWGATHSTSIAQGLDQEMPGGDFMGDALLKMAQSGAVSNATIDGSVTRILKPLIEMGVLDNANPNKLTANVSTAASVAAAREIASAAMVLLSNKGGMLPLECGPGLKTLAVVGVPAKTPIVGGGGSGSVVPSFVRAPLDALAAKLAACGGSVTYVESHEDGGADKAKAADAAVIFVQTTSSEGGDRSDLSLKKQDTDYDQDAMVSAIAAAQPNAAVVVVAPGAVLTPWRGDVAAIVAAFMPGQAYGDAVTDVLFGDVNPSGRLPLTLPTKENEVNFTTSQYPGDDDAENATYSEGLFVGYRWYDQHAVEPAFPFGHGLSYTTFAYGIVKATDTVVTVTVTNTGAVAGAEVVQLYVTFPAAAGEPPSVLRGFEKVVLEPNASADVSFKLAPTALSTWEHGWVPSKGTFGVSVGASSRDIRGTASFVV